MNHTFLVFPVLLRLSHVGLVADLGHLLHILGIGIEGNHREGLALLRITRTDVGALVTLSTSLGIPLRNDVFNTWLLVGDSAVYVKR